MRRHRSGHRYRFGRLAAVVAGGYFAAIVVFCVVAFVTGDGEVLWRLVVRSEWQEMGQAPGWWVPLVVLVGGAQGWALWQILRGRVVGGADGSRGDGDESRGIGGERTVGEGREDGGAGAPREVGKRDGTGRHVRRLRVVLYANLAAYPVFLLATLPWWAYVADDLGQIALVVLFHKVLHHASRLLRGFAFVAGMLGAVASIGESISDELDFPIAEGVFEFAGLGGFAWVFWMALTLVAQAGDGRWGRTTVWTGAAAIALPTLVLPFVFLPFMFSPFGGGALAGVLAGGFTFLMPVWLARSAHDLGGPPARTVRGRERPVPVRAPFGGWPPPVVAVVLPLLPVAVNLAHGMPFWIGPRGVAEDVFSTYLPGLVSLWQNLDLLVGVGGAGVLVLVAVVRRTRRVVRVTVGALLLVAALGVVTAVTVHDPVDISDDGMTFLSVGLPMYPAEMFVPDPETGEILFGVSPLWHSAALAVSALILTSLYGWGGPARRSPYRVAVTCLAPVVALCLLPVADQARGPVTSPVDCEPPEGRRGERVEPPPMTGEKAFVCAVRTSGGLPSARNVPDLALVEYGHRLCGVYTRNDPEEIVRVREVDGVEVSGLASVLAGICPRAATVVKAASDAEKRETLEWEAEEQRKCDEVPRHRPLIRPVSASVFKKPLWTDYGVMEAYEPTESDSDPFQDGLLDLLNKNELVAAIPGHLMVGVHSDFSVCATTETYTRRPPVETKGWHHVVEVGYRSPTGELRLADAMGGPELPDLAFRGKGDYRIRVHYAWLPWKGEKRAGQRLLIMAYPGRGDDVVVHRARTTP